MQENLQVEHLNDRLYEHQLRVQAHLLRIEAQEAQKANAAESCGAWCQVKRRAGAIRLAPRYN